MKRKKSAAHVATFAACLSMVCCGGDTDPGPADPPKDGGQGGAGGSLGPGSGGTAGSGFGGFGGFVIPDSGLDPRDCPMLPPQDRSSCSMRITCRYPDGVCTCVRPDGQDASGREWNCFDTMPRDGGMCPRDPPREGDFCMNPGQKCAGGNQGVVCTCEAGDGSQEWRC